jgi:transketolase N-terminal domain/subunit
VEHEEEEQELEKGEGKEMILSPLQRLQIKSFVSIVEHCKKRLDGFSTTLAEDERLLKEHEERITSTSSSSSFSSSSSPPSFNVFNAIKLRLGEKRIWEAIMKDASSVLRNLQHI